MNYLSVCSGIEAATVGWHLLGWQAVAFSEIEPFPCAALAHHYPNVPNWGDMTKFKEWPDAAVDVLVGGTPCQSFSVAGLRKGLDDPRGNLMLTYLAIAAKYRPEWLVWENVPGVLSSNEGRDFASLLRGLGECGYGFAYRILDAQYFGVPQRRRRVFVVGHLGSWQRAAAVLFERHSLQGHPAPRREAGKRVAGTISKCSFDGGAGGRPEGAAAGHFQPVVMSTGQAGAEIGIGIGTTLNCNHEAPLVTVAFDTTQITSPENGSNPQPGDPCHPLAAGAHPPAIAYSMNTANTGANGLGVAAEVAPTLDRAQPCAIAFTQDSQSVVAPTLTAANDPSRSPQSSEVTQQVYSVYKSSMAVRRLTPVECERLQGFPDNYTQVPYRNKPAADGPRYKALGNSMAVPVMAWIGKRIQQVESI